MLYYTYFAYKQSEYLIGNQVCQMGHILFVGRQKWSMIGMKIPEKRSGVYFNTLNHRKLIEKSILQEALKIWPSKINLKIIWIFLAINYSNLWTQQPNMCTQEYRSKWWNCKAIEAQVSWVNQLTTHTQSTKSCTGWSI